MTGLKKKVLTACVVLIAISLAVGCTGTTDSITGRRAEVVKTYTIGDAAGDWGYPSPYAHYPRGPGYIRMSFLFETLVWKDSQGFVPSLADSWEYIPEDNAYIFHLNENIHWHDGRQFSAEDVKFTFEYIKKHPYPWVNAGTVSKTEVLGEYVIKVYLKEQYAPFMERVAGTLPIIPKHIWKNVSDPMRFQETAASVGTGPFKLLDYNHSHGTYLFGKNSSYYRGKQVVDSIRFVKMNAEIGGAALEQKKVNAVQVPPDLTNGLHGEGFSIISGSHDWAAKLMINHNQYPFSEKRFRQALAYAINRSQLVETLLRGHGLPGSQGLLPPDNPWYNENTPSYPHDPQKARQLLGELGFEKNGSYLEKDGAALEVELLFSEGGNKSFGAPGERAAEIIRGDLEQVGIKVKLRNLEAKTLDSAVENWNFDLALSGHGGMGGDPEMINTATLENGFNSARYRKNNELTNLLEEQLREMVPGQRSRIIDRVQEIYAEELPCICLYYPTWYWAHDGSVDLFFTHQGIALGIPIPFNKLAFIDTGGS